MSAHVQALSGTGSELLTDSRARIAYLGEGV